MKYGFVKVASAIPAVKVALRRRKPERVARQKRNDAKKRAVKAKKE